jgi:hypothetical protein
VARADLADARLMRLGLSSAAAPNAGLDELLAACTRRGLSTVELRAGDAHGIADDGDWAAPVASGLAAAAQARVTIAGYQTAAPSNPWQLARLSEALGCPILVPDEGDISSTIARARRISAAGGRALVLARGPALAWHPAITRSGLEYGWEVDAGCGDVAADAEMVLQAEPALRYIRFIGGGPEATLQEGRGIGTLMGRLALAGYDGAVILAPSSPRYRVAWESWLGRRGGWGCGSRTADAELVHLPVRTATGGKR